MRVEFKNACNELLELLCEPITELVCSLQHALFDLFYRLSSEGSVSMDKFVEEHSKGPDVHVITVGRSEEHFRGHVLIGAAESCARCGDVFGTPSEIA